MAGFNRVIMVGNLTRDPDYKQLASGQAVCRLGLATNRQFKNKQTGSMVQEVCYIDVDVWGPQAESCRQYLQKGRPVLIEGRLKLDSWEDTNGQTKNRHTIVADRVVFLTAHAEASVDSIQGAVGSDVYQDQSHGLEEELIDQIDTLKTRVQTTAKDPKKSALTKNAGFGDYQVQTGEIDFKDEPPFEDDLPF